MFANNSQNFPVFPEFRRPNTNGFNFNNFFSNVYNPMFYQMMNSSNQVPQNIHEFSLQKENGLNLIAPTPNLLDQSIAYPNIWNSFQNLCKKYEHGLSNKSWLQMKIDTKISQPDILPLNLSCSTMSSPSSKNSYYSDNSDCSIKSSKSKTYSCPDCGKRYCTESGMKRHQSQKCNIIKKDVSLPISDITNSGSVENRQYSCRQCNKVYFSLSALKMHVRTHTLPCKCNVCGKAFSRMWLLTGHMRTHTGEKPFSCGECDRAFADRSNLRAHMQTHSQTKRYQCEQCHKTFSRMGLLTKHRSSCSSV